MLQKFEITGLHTEVDEGLRKYITKKLGRVDKYLAKHSRESAHMEVRLKEEKRGGKKQCVCDVTLHLPHDTIQIKEGTLNMYAAVDIAETKLKQQIEKYKESHTDAKRQRHLLARLSRSGKTLPAET
jgi:putative sigma-54 modulation protein